MVAGFQVSAVVRTCTRLPGHRRGDAVSCELYRRGHSNSHLMDHDWAVLQQNKATMCCQVMFDSLLVSFSRKCFERHQHGFLWALSWPIVCMYHCGSLLLMQNVERKESKSILLPTPRKVQ